MTDGNYFIKKAYPEQVGFFYEGNSKDESP